jgi:hypothetical protein
LINNGFYNSNTVLVKALKPTNVAPEAQQKSKAELGDKKFKIKKSKVKK